MSLRLLPLLICCSKQWYMLIYMKHPNGTKHQTNQNKIAVYLDAGYVMKATSFLFPLKVWILLFIWNASHPIRPTKKVHWCQDGLMNVFPICPNNIGHIGLCNIIDSLLSFLPSLGRSGFRHVAVTMLRCQMWRMSGSIWSSLEQSLYNHSTPQPCLVDVY